MRASRSTRKYHISVSTNIPMRIKDSRNDTGGYRS